MREYWTAMASLVGLLAFCHTLLQTVFPPEVRYTITKYFNRTFHWFSSHCYFEITEIDGVNTNELYNAAQLYLSSSVSISGSRLSLTRALNSSAFTFGLPNNDTMVDTFNGVHVLWEHVVTQRQSQPMSWRPMPEEKRIFTLRIKKKDRPLILNSYFDYIMEKSNEIRRKNQDRLLYTNSRGGSLDSRGQPWESVPFKHSSTFETLAMDPEKKKKIMEDLQDFANGQAFYHSTGRAWKRGYLLYGPPGTGKSSMIAAMANYLGYDIYDLELTEVQHNSELRKLLMKTSSKSIIVIEDIDCSVNLTNREKKKNPGSNSNSYLDLGSLRGRGSAPARGEDSGSSVTLSGLLNFTDGLWSCCGSERIFLFTTNHVEKLDPALVRSGRMDMHILMGYCAFPALKILLKNYLGCEEGNFDESVLKELEKVIDKAQMTPADISEVLIKNNRKEEKAVNQLLETLKLRAERNEKNGVLSEKNRKQDEEEEEHEKRTVESHKHQESGIEDNLQEEEKVK